jgi:signal transduction histidine kinase
MTLRTKLLALFVALAVVPLIAVGAYGYAQSMRALEALLERQTTAVVDDAANAVTRELTRKEPFLLMLAENDETQRLYRERGWVHRDSAFAKADTFFTAAWSQAGSEYQLLELSDETGNVIYQKGNTSSRYSASSVPLERDIRDPQSGNRRGHLVLETPLDALLPRDVLDRHVGDHGYSVVIDRRSGRVVSHPRATFIGQSLARLRTTEPWADTSRFHSPTHTFHYGSDDSVRVVSFANLQAPPWTVMSIASVADFAPPFERARSVQLTIVLALTALITIAFVQLLRGATRSLEDLTRAAETVGRGDLDPALPRPESDEVGRLTVAFDQMVRRVREMITQVESSRQMAVIGEFASRIAHEIRNPLTSIKLNLQGLARDARLGSLPAHNAAAVDICLLEIDRLDGVVGGVLTLAQTAPTNLVPCSLHTIVLESLRVVAAQADAQGVIIDTGLHAEPDAVRADGARLHAALLNLLLNALAAMPHGGQLIVSTSVGSDGSSDRLFVRVRDSGAGVPPGERDRIFRPFHTTRPNGTGLGLPIARRTIEALGGRLTLSDDSPEHAGAEFVVELPVTNQCTNACTEVSAQPVAVA